MVFPVTFDVPDDDVTLVDVGAYLPWYHYIDTGTTVAVVDDLLTRAGLGGKAFLRIYTEDKMAAAGNR